jgi:hypothetical protein
VSSSRRASAVLVLILLISVAIGAKLSLRGSAEAPVFAFMSRITELLEANGFFVDNVLPPTALLEGVSARRGNCRLLIANASPFGYNQDTLKRAAAPGDVVFFLYKGERYADQPKWRTSIDFYWSRLNRLVGRFLRLDPVIGVVASASCAAPDTRWLEEAALLA